MPLLTIKNLSGPPIEVPLGSTLLSGIHAAGYDWWHACGAKGRCTTCRVQVLVGAEYLAPATEPELRYQAAGRLGLAERLACQAQVLPQIL
jgi:2Fe-2S ferredoxin